MPGRHSPFGGTASIPTEALIAPLHEGQLGGQREVVHRMPLGIEYDYFAEKDVAICKNHLRIGYFSEHLWKDLTGAATTLR